MSGAWTRLRELSIAAAAFALVWWAQGMLRESPRTVPLSPGSPLAAMAGDGPIDDSRDWIARRVPVLREAFQSDIYGMVPPLRRVAARRTLDPQAFGGAARLDLLTLSHGAGDRQPPLQVALFTPAGDGPFPAIILSAFCGLDNDVDPRLPAPAWRPERCRTRLGRILAAMSHGDAILDPPVRAIIARGYAAAVFYAGDTAPDDPGLFRAAFAAERGAESDSGAIAAWASLYLSTFETLRTHPQVSATRIALWGHSRYGKAALLAGALDERVGAVIANQSGTFGATPSRATRGETTAQLARRFPHWLPERVATAGGAQHAEWLDQHLLLALLAPRPLLLGNARLDRWSDPAASFSAARAASEVYQLFAKAGLVQTSMSQTDLEADIAFYMRAGGHGVRSSDWTRALAFLDAHFTGPRAP